MDDENEIFDGAIDENMFLEDFELPVGELRKKVQTEEQGEKMTKDEFFKSYKVWRAVHSLINETTKDLFIEKGDKTLNPTELFGMWEENPRNIREIREHAYAKS